MREREAVEGSDRSSEADKGKKKEGRTREGDGKKVEDDEKGKGTRDYLRKREERDKMIKETEGIIIKRQGGKITYGAALASIHAFYSLAVSAHADQTTSPITLPHLPLTRPLSLPSGSLFLVH